MSGQSITQKPIAAGNDQHELTTDDVFEILGNHRRRYIFYHLKYHPNKEVTLRELTDVVAAWENRQPVEAVSQAKHNSVRTALRQCHIPKMCEYGFVEYDPQQQMVSLRRAAADLDVYLDLVGRGNLPWGLYYIGLAVIFGMLVTAANVGLPLISAISEVTFAGVLSVLLALSAVIHTYISQTQRRIGRSENPPEIIQ